MSDEHDESVRRLKELGKQLDAAQQSGKRAVHDISKAKATTKRVKKSVQRIIDKAAARKLGRKKR